MQMFNYKKSHLVIFLVFLYLQLNGQDPQDGWDFEYTGDLFTNNALLDLRYLNENTAGENGFIRLSESGEGFVNDKGEIRFWATNGGRLIVNHDPDLNDQDLEFYARFLAKIGVNMIRFHGRIFSTTEDINVPNYEEIDRIWKVVSIMKSAGIYTTISPFWPAHLKEIPQSWNLGDYKGDKDPWGLLYFDQHFRNAYKEWVTYLYSEVNPYTGNW